MPSIYSYQKYITPEISRWLVMPVDPVTLEPLGTELATIDGVTYVSLPDNIILPEQPPEIAESVQLVTLTPELAKTIRDSSQHCALIEQRVIEKIRAVYSLEREQYYARISTGVLLSETLKIPIYSFEPGELEEVLAFGQYVEGCRQWGRDERAKLGL